MTNLSFDFENQSLKINPNGTANIRTFLLSGHSFNDFDSVDQLRIRNFLKKYFQESLLDDCYDFVLTISLDDNDLDNNVVCVIFCDKLNDTLILDEDIFVFDENVLSFSDIESLCDDALSNIDFVINKIPNDIAR